MFLEPCRAAAQRIGIPDEHLIVIDGAAGHPDVRTLLAERRQPPDVLFDPATHVATLPYSSGTTGTPKGVMISDRNLIANVLQVRELTVVGPDDRLHAMMPFFHMYGLTVLLNVALRARASIVPMARFDFVEFLEQVQRTRCTFVCVAPPVVVALAKHPVVEQYDLSAVRIVFSAAAPLDGDTARAAAARVGAPVRQGYGLSELTAGSHVAPADDDSVPSTSVGVVLPNETCRLVDPSSGEDIDSTGADGWSRPGELWVAGPNVMLGYLGNPDATDATVDADGYLHTGDIAVRHADGYFAIVDRLKELIKYHGHQVAPAELEALLLSHPQVADAAVIGVADVDGEEVPKAFVVRAPDAVLSDADVMAWVAERVEPHEKVRRVEFVDRIPRTSAGKILRRELRERERVAAG
jgi:4-coumarate--CoA ligase